VPFANSSVSDLIATGIDSRTGEIANNVLGSTPVLAAVKAKGRVKTASGGIQIMEELSFNSNPNGGAYEGDDILPTASADVISGALYDWKQYACAVTITGREQRINSGKEALLDLLDERMEVAEDTMSNLIDTGLLGDGTGYGGKAITGLKAMFESNVKASQTTTVGGISKTTYAFWRHYYATAATSDTTGVLLRAALNTAFANQSRGKDQPDVVLLGSTLWQRHLQGAQAIQRFTDSNTAAFGFNSLKYMNADVFLMGGAPGVGGYDYTTSADTLTAFILNTKWLRWRPHAQCNFVSGGKRESTTQDMAVNFLLFMGNLTCRGMQFQGRFLSSD
jgi:hypothetical protein